MVQDQRHTDPVNKLCEGAAQQSLFTVAAPTPLSSSSTLNLESLAMRKPKAAHQHVLTLAEIEQWKEDFITQVTEALLQRFGTTRGVPAGLTPRHTYLSRCNTPHRQAA